METAMLSPDRIFDSTQLSEAAADYEVVRKAIGHIRGHWREQPEIEAIAEAAGVTPTELHHLFRRWAGLTPKAFLQALTLDGARQLLRDSASVLDASYEVGLSGPGRLHDLFVTHEAMSPGEWKNGGAGMTLAYGFHPSPFGRCLLAVTERGICGLSFLQEAPEESLVRNLQARWPGARLRQCEDATGEVARRIFTFDAPSEPGPLHLFVRGTNFQIQVWEALIRIPFGKVVTYEDVARHIGMPSAPRAVGNAVGSNPIPFLIPCHRVIRKLGEFGNYGEGPQRKKAILGWEAALTSGEESA